jgi:hypothetical protein
MLRRSGYSNHAQPGVGGQPGVAHLHPVLGLPRERLRVDCRGGKRQLLVIWKGLRVDTGPTTETGTRTPIKVRAAMILRPNSICVSHFHLVKRPCRYLQTPPPAVPEPGARCSGPVDHTPTGPSTPLAFIGPMIPAPPWPATNRSTIPQTSLTSCPAISTWCSTSTSSRRSSWHCAPSNFTDSPTAWTRCCARSANRPRANSTAAQ